MENTGTVLIIDDNEDILLSLKLLLKPHVGQVITETNPDKIPELFQKNGIDTVVLDMNFKHDAISGQEGFNLKKILEIDSEAVVIFITAYGNTEKAVNAIKAGATDFVLKPWQNEKMIATVLAGIKLRQSRRETTTQKTRIRQISDVIDQPFKDIVFQSAAMRKVLDTVQKVAPTDASVLILGENGTGKEVIARAIHRNSLRNQELFVSVDLGAIPDTLFESELFGYEKGAFTDAKQSREGRFEMASGGTLFLDEIGNLSLPMQAKLLTVLERREVIRLGSNLPKKIDIRLICATNADIFEMRNQGAFRQDLLYRINTVEIRIPPLRERPEDISVLAWHYFEIFVKKYRKDIRKISSAAIQKLELYPWPGNIRELQHAIERAVILSERSALEADDFTLEMDSSRASSEIPFETFNLEEIEKKVIQTVMDKVKGNISLAAKILGITRASLYRRIEKHDI